MSCGFFPALDKAGWREAPGWFEAVIPQPGSDFYRRSQRQTIRRCAKFSLRNKKFALWLLGPRRIGKTSIARALMRVMGEAGWQVVEINVAACRDERAFVEKLETALRQETASLGGKLWGAVGASLGAIRARIEAVRTLADLRG